MIRFIAALNLIFTLGCALFQSPSRHSQEVPFVAEVYKASFEDVWRAVQVVMSDYPLKVNNIDSGILETEILRKEDIWNPPIERPSSYRYKISVQVLKGHVGKAVATRVKIQKRILLKKDFFSSGRWLSGDGLEERALLYRIGREIKVHKLLEKANAKG
ncbi:MAG: hypothetical protein D6797_06600 [Bdellovibrio sp.]|nr:MAG: hypothetical protein D6797_06600 [Bdellovibrio sp.]